MWVLATQKILLACPLMSLKHAKINVLKEELKFSLEPKKLLMHNIICSVEYEIQSPDHDDKESIEQYCPIILRGIRPPRNNIGREEHCTLKKTKKVTVN
jgi:hypothetical protein